MTVKVMPAAQNILWIRIAYNNCKTCVKHKTNIQLEFEYYDYFTMAHQPLVGQVLLDIEAS
jgi:hypothetical protein